MLGRRTLTAPLLLLVILANGSAVAGQQDDLLENAYGPKMIRARTFFETLQRDMAAGNKQGVCAVVHYPLEQSLGDVASASACRARFGDIFSADVIRVVTSNRFDDLMGWSGDSARLVVGDGALSFDALCLNQDCTRTEIRVTSVRGEQEIAASDRPPKGRVLLACHTKAERLELVADGSHGVELRLWKARRPRTLAPDVHIRSGSTRVEGSSSCASQVWEFSADSQTYVVATGGCYADSNPPPKGTLGHFAVQSHDGSERFDYCIR